MLGLIGKKQGMMSVFNENGESVTVSAVKVDENVIVGLRTVEKDGYNAIIVGTDNADEKRLNKSQIGYFSKNNVAYKNKLKEFRVDDISKFEIGQTLTLDMFEKVKFVDIAGVSKGKGFQGVMKRHGFHGGRKTHGSKFHRQNGSTGQCAWPSRCFKGIKRAGRMGADNKTILNLKLFGLEKDSNVILIKGSIPGNNQGLVYVTPAKKKK